MGTLHKFNANLIEEYYPSGAINDFFNKTLLYQLLHEQLVKEYMANKNLEEVEVHGQKYKPEFKIDYDFEQYKDDCLVCNKRVCNYKSKY